MRFTDTPELAQWRAKVRNFVAENWEQSRPHDELAMHGPNAAEAPADPPQAEDRLGVQWCCCSHCST